MRKWFVVPIILLAVLAAIPLAVALTSPTVAVQEAESVQMPATPTMMAAQDLKTPAIEDTGQTFVEQQPALTNEYAATVHVVYDTSPAPALISLASEQKLTSADGVIDAEDTPSVTVAYGDTGPAVAFAIDAQKMSAKTATQAILT
ncbi:MAG: hypothetical protein WCV92_00310 [Candidatus Buchananbacteria bacterium]